VNISVPVRRDRHFLDAIDHLYAAALDPGEWRNFLTSAASLFHADNAYVSQIEHDRRTLDYVVLRPLNWDAVSVGRYAALMDEDPRMPAFRANPFRPLHCRMVVPEKRLRESRIYIEALAPLDIEYTMVVGVPERAGVTNYLGFTRGRSASSFDVADCSLLNELVPHLIRAFEIRRTIMQCERREVISGLILERLPHGILIVNRDGKVFQSNSAARELLASGRGLRLVDDQLHIDDRADQAMLISALAKFCETSGTASAQLQTIILKSKSDKAPLALIIKPLVPMSPRPSQRAQPSDLALISIPAAQRTMHTDEGLLRRAFGLSPVQTRLTVSLMSGRTLKESAAILGITESTARQYLKIIFNKTGTQRQSDLVRIVSNALTLKL
jgi:DNA-binding CsgD family transcriptional regulator/PAS domain-containing protein